MAVSPRPTKEFQDIVYKLSEWEKDPASSWSPNGDCIVPVGFGQGRVALDEEAVSQSRPEFGACSSGAAHRGNPIFLAMLEVS